MADPSDERPVIDELEILKQAVDNTNEAFITIDRYHKVYIFNRAAERIFGYKREEVVGRDLGVIMSPACSRNHRGAVERYVQSRVPRRIGHETEITATRRNGETFPASISFSVTEIDKELFFTAIVRDLSETKALMEQLAVSERLAAIGKLVAEISHEIKNPLMIIGGLAQQLHRGTADEKGREKLAIISQEVKRLEGLISEMRDYYSPRPLKSEPVDIPELFHGILAPLADEFGSRGIRVETDFPKDARWAEGDALKLKQIFLNLVKNAMESMNNGGTLRVASRLKNDIVEIDVSDEGCGIPEKEKERLFTPFFTTKSKGTGLGLCVVKSIVEQHRNGSVSVESKEGVGTVVTVRLSPSREPR